MTKSQIGWLLFAAAFAQITVLLVGDILTLVESHGQMDVAFVRGITMHYTAVATAFAGGKLLKQIGGDETVSDQKRAELQSKVGV